MEDKLEKLEAKVSEQIKEYLTKFAGKLRDDIEQIVYEVANSYIDVHADSEPVSNYLHELRCHLFREGASWAIDEKSDWGRKIREAIYEEHKEQILPLIQNEQLEDLQFRYKLLKRQYDFFTNTESPGKSFKSGDY